MTPVLEMLKVQWKGQKSQIMMIKFGKCSQRSVGAGRGAEEGDFTCCLRQLNKVTFELVLEERIVLLAENGEEGKVYMQRTAYTMMENQTPFPRDGNFYSPGVWDAWKLGCKVVYEGS